jgi:hypothetical protein
VSAPEAQEGCDQYACSDDAHGEEDPCDLRMVGHEPDNRYIKIRRKQKKKCTYEEPPTPLISDTPVGFGFAITCVYVTNVPSEFVDVLKTVTAAGKVKAIFPAESVVVIGTALENVDSG